jgi:hypothetical protein
MSEYWCVNVHVGWEYERDVDDHEMEFGYSCAHRIVGPFPTAADAEAFASVLLSSRDDAAAFMQVRGVDPDDVEMSWSVEAMHPLGVHPANLIRELAEASYEHGKAVTTDD